MTMPRPIKTTAATSNDERRYTAYEIGAARITQTAVTRFFGGAIDGRDIGTRAHESTDIDGEKRYHSVRHVTDHDIGEASTSRS